MPLARSAAATGQTLSPFRLTSRMARSKPSASTAFKRLGDTVAAGRDVVPERHEEILEHHRDQRLVFDDQDGARPGHAIA